MTIAEILRLSVEDRKSAYKADGIGKIKIDGNEFTDYKAFSFLWEKSYVKSPERSGDGSIGNLNSYATFVTPHLKIDFSMMSIDSYRTLMQLLYSKNEFIVECYDIVNNKPTTNKMYFSTEEMPKLWTIARAINGEEWTELLGVQDYTVEMVGTNVSLETVEIRYHDENGKLIAEATQYFTKNTDAIIDYDFVAPSGTRFDGAWNTKLDKTGTKYINGSAVLLQGDLDLYPELAQTNQYTLTFVFGNGVIPIAQDTTQIVSVPIVKGQTLGEAIANAKIKMPDGTNFTFPSSGTGSQVVVYDGKNYTPYEFKGWYWTEKASPQTKVDENTVFDSDFGRIIYQVYEPKEYYLSYVSNSSAFYFMGNTIKYGDNAKLPTIASMDGTQINGWYLDQTFKKQFDGVMPPTSITIYAKWG